MFLKDDLVKVLFCPVNHDWTNEDVKLIEKRFAPTGIDWYPYYDLNGKKQDFYPSDYERKNAFWLVEMKPGVQAMAFVGHKIEPGDDALIVKAPIGWKELDGRIKTVEGVDEQRRIRVRSVKNIAVTIEDYRPIKIMTKEPVVDGLDKSVIAQAIIETLDNGGTISAKGTELLTKLGIDLTDDVEVTAPTHVSLDFSLDVKYPKGIPYGDSVAVARALAKKMKAMSTSELEDYLLNAW